MCFIIIIIVFKEFFFSPSSTLALWQTRYIAHALEWLCPCPWTTCVPCSGLWGQSHIAYRRRRTFLLPCLLQKKDALDNVTGQIYLPITGYAGLDVSTNTYKKVEKALCCYWTSTPSPATSSTSSSATDRAREKSYAFYTKYEIDPDNPSTGHMSSKNDAIQEYERYNGFAIRPVLMREKIK